MKHLAVGILAHVDAGKTTLSEGLLYQGGTISAMGRVDNQNAYLDTEEIERARGITVFSKQAVIRHEDCVITLLDTPGHVDFSAEMERTIWVMDYAILVVSGVDGVQGHTYTLWRLLEKYNIPVFVFVNKMDRPDTNQGKILEQLQKEFGDGFVDFTDTTSEDFMEQIAVCDEELMEAYLGGEGISTDQIAGLIRQRKTFPVFYGSALKNEGIDTFFRGFLQYTEDLYGDKETDAFGAKVFKIARDAKGERLTYMKITSGVLNTKDLIKKQVDGSLIFEEKNNQIRIYSGEQYEMVQKAEPGVVCAVTGLTLSRPGDGLGREDQSDLPVLEPVLNYSVLLPEEVDAAVALPLFRQLEEEEPEFRVLWQEESKSIMLSLMGEVQLEVLTKLIKDRFNMDVKFGTGDIVYKETIADVVEGVGHFEPLRHYAEVHLILEPLPEGSGLQFVMDCSEDILDKNWQRLIYTHLEEKVHLGVLTGAPLTDVCISIVSGRAHTKHTEGGDFRQATYRAVRQGLMEAESILLEPYYDFRMELPVDCIGRAMTDVENMFGKFEPPIVDGDRAVLLGNAPVSTMRDYQITLNSYSKGLGSLFCSLKGYGPCHDAEEVIEKIGYNPDEDLENPTGSVFCAHGAGFLVPWNQVKSYMHVESCFESEEEEIETYDDETLQKLAERKASLRDYSIDEEQIEAILNKTFHANGNAKKQWKRSRNNKPDIHYKGQPKPKNQTKYLIVDGYNIVHAWDDLKCLVEDNIEGARMRLLDILSNYQGFTKLETIVVFDAYRVKGNLGEMFDYQNIHVVYTKEAETADAYIEKLTHKISRDYQVTVATSDGLVQLITRGNNCTVMSARDLKEEIARINEQIKEFL